MTVYCRDCDNVCESTRKDEPWRWRCIKVPTKGGFGYVDPDYSPTPPYALCKYLRNNEDCDMFTPRRIAPQEEKK